ncbi:uncharacterized protein AKAME5_001407200 [Lates japonicus]|uniref:Uncharacterized protein n=1 Tax=Lates japonicus TaxID=270547 RepID=A0AAD3RBV5_LATJO|nr:uncharacterized protein AKAME5_001407200 [Lates japonicus]
MLAAGTPDSATESGLVDMVTEIVQTVSTEVLKFVKPMFEGEMQRKTSQADIRAALEDVSIYLENSLSESFAAALGMSQDKCDSAEKLAALVEKEVLQKVSSIASAAVGNVWPSQPAVFVTGSVTTTSLRYMVFHATRCLKRYLGKLNSECLGHCWRPKNIEFSQLRSSGSTSQILETEEREPLESSQSLKSKISVPSATEAVTDILMKWSGKTPDMDVSLSLDAHYAASDIVRDVQNNLHHDFGHVAEHSVKSNLPKPHFNMGLIHNKVREFFTSQVKPTTHSSNTNQTLRKCNFCRFVLKQFEKMVADLRGAFKSKESKFLVSLEQDSASSLRLMGAEDSSEVLEDILPGVMPDDTRSRPQTPRTLTPTSQTTIINVVKKEPYVTLDNVKTDVDILYDKLYQPERPAAFARRTLENFKSSGEIRAFSRELVNKMYNHLMVGHTYQLPLVSSDRCLSDSVISELQSKGGDTQSHFSPEVLYAMTEDAVEKFLQHVFLWMEKERLEKRNYIEEVSGALTDIEDLFTDILNSTEEASNMQRTTPCHAQASQPESFSSDDDCDGLNVRVHFDTRNFISGKLASRDENSKTYSQQTKSSYHAPEERQFTPSITPDEPEKGHAAVSMSRSLSSSEGMTNDLITALFMRLIINVPWRNRGSLGSLDIDSIIKKLSDIVQKEVDIEDSGITKGNIKKINKAVIKDLHREFGSSNRLLNAAIASNDTSFDDAVVKYLKVHLDNLTDAPPRKSAAARFFAAVGRGLTRPFTWCRRRSQMSSSPL